MSISRTGPQLAVDTCARRLGAIDRAGEHLGPDVRISWHGPAGFTPDRPGSEASIQAMCGLMEVNGRDQATPRRVGLEVASVAAGLLAAQGAIAAAIAGLRGGPVPMVQTSVLQAGLVLLSHYFVVATGLGDAVPGPPLPQPGPPFRSADGRWFEIETLDAEPWKEFWERVGAADADLGRAWTVFRWRYERATCSLPAGLHEAVARFTLPELQRLAIEADVSLTPLRGYAEVLADLDSSAAHPAVRTLGDAQPGAPAPVRTDPYVAAALPLAGIKVVEATSRIQGPFAGMLLRMLGADVLRVQPPEGDYGRAALCLHREKDAVRLDLSGPGGRAELVDLIAGADVFLQNWRPGKAAEWELDFEDLAPRHPALVYANASGWGERPEARRLVGTDFLVQAHTALGAALNPPDEPPFPSRMILCDLFGGLVAAEGILTGLYRRERTGGQACDVRSSLLAGAMTLQAHVVDDLAQGKEDGRIDGRPVWGPLGRPIATTDGMLALSVEDDESFGRLCLLCEVDPSATTRVGIESRLAARLAEGTAAAWEQRLVGAGIAAAVVRRDLAAVPAEPGLAELFEPVGMGGLAPRSPWAFR